jgi:ATP-dependent DNA helicase RecG
MRWCTKDYSSGIPIQISVYEDHIVFWNAGQLPLDWTLEKLLGKHPSCPFNPLLASAFFRAGYIESWGRGIEKIERECREHGIDAPLYDSSMSGLMLTFQANPQHLRAAMGHEDAPEDAPKVGEKVGDRVGEKVGDRVGETSEKRSEKLRRKGRKKGSEESLTPNQRQILSLLRQNGRLTARELAEEVGISSRKIEQNIARLKESGTLRRIGPDRGGSWEVLK